MPSFPAGTSQAQPHAPVEPATEMSRLAAKYVAVPLREIEISGTRIFEPASGQERARVGVTDQFLAHAAEYHQRYTAHGYFRGLIEAALARSGIRSVSSVLDLGSGSGNSVVPSLDLFPRAEIVAVDISPQLLAILRSYLDTARRDGERVLTVCLDAAANIYVPGSFDLCIGSAILHHVMDPGEVVATALSALEPGGHAIFFEPFEGGNAMLRLAYHRILESWRAPFLPRPVRNLLQNMVRDFDVRMDTDWSDPIFTTLDDKWMFTRTFFQRVANEAGATAVTVHPLHDLERPFATQTESNLRLGAGLGPDALPRWAWAIVKEMDARLSPRLKEDLITEGCVTFRK